MPMPVLVPGTSKPQGTQEADTQVRPYSLSPAVPQPAARAEHAGVGGIKPPLHKPWQLPAHGLAVFHGETPRLSHYFLPRLLLEGKRVLFLDGANCADPRLLERLARQRGVPFEQFNRQVQIARAFTCFQLTELIARVPQFLADFPAQVLIVTASPELYFDEDVRDWDAGVAFAQALAHLRRLASVAAVEGKHCLPDRRCAGLQPGSNDANLKVGSTMETKSPLAVAVFSAAPNHAGLAPSPARQCFFNQVCAAASEVWKFTRGEDNHLGLTCERAIAGAAQASPLHGSWQRATGRGGLCPPAGRVEATSALTERRYKRGALWAER